MRFSNFYFIFCYFLANVSGYRKLDIQQNQEKYEKYVKCVEDRVQVTKKLGIRRPFKALIFPRGGSIKLSCFECLSPEAESDIEELWKPTDSFIGRAIRVLKDKVRKTIRNLAPDAEDEGPEKVSFRWEYQPPKQGAEWTPAIDLHEPKGLAAKAAKVISGFMGRDKSTVEIGDHYELEIVKANHSEHAGFYRCLRVGRRRQVIEAAYFVDIVTDAVAKVTSDSDEDANIKAESAFITDVSDEAEAVWRSMPWSECNVCGDGEGEQRRRIECVVQPKPGASIEALASSNLHFLTLFESVPCSSSLLPLEIRESLAESAVWTEQYRVCESVCPISENETRVIKEIDDEGNEFVADELPPHEFNLFERLPLLKSAVIRKTIRETVGNSLILDCGRTSDIQWRKDFEDISSADLQNADSNAYPRRYITAEGQFVIRKLTMKDAGFYSCLSTPRFLQRTFRVYISEANWTAECIGYIQIGIRYFTGLLMMVLIARVILKTNTTSERQVRRGRPSATK